MTKSYLCISIPEELQKFSKVIDILECEEDTGSMFCDFGVKPIKDKSGITIGTAYYSDNGELLKKVMYKGSSVDYVEHYRNNRLYAQEKYIKGSILRKTLYSPSGNEASIIHYKYNSKDQIVSIQKVSDKIKCTIEYGYDELFRVNSRVVIIDKEVINEQKFRYDILDRIVEYQDCNQRINVHKVNSKNELVSYTITDVVGNKIVINNKFMCSDYIGTEIEVNSHKTTVKDISYVNNVMLKKPYTSEDDLDFALSHLEKLRRVSSKDVITTRREQRHKTEDVTDMIINRSKARNNSLNISIDDIKLIQM